MKGAIDFFERFGCFKIKEIDQSAISVSVTVSDFVMLDLVHEIPWQIKMGKLKNYTISPVNSNLYKKYLVRKS